MTGSAAQGFGAVRSATAALGEPTYSALVAVIPRSSSESQGLGGCSPPRAPDAAARRRTAHTAAPTTAATTHAAPATYPIMAVLPPSASRDAAGRQHRVNAPALNRVCELLQWPEVTPHQPQRLQHCPAEQYPSWPP